MEAHIDDIIEAVEELDTTGKLPIFVAVNLGKLPNLEPEEYNRLYYINRVAKLEKAANQHRNELDDVNKHILDLKDEMRNKLAEMSFDIALTRSRNDNDKNDTVSEGDIGVSILHSNNSNETETNDGEVSVIQEPGNDSIIDREETSDTHMSQTECNNNTNNAIYSPEQHQQQEIMQPDQQRVHQLDKHQQQTQQQIQHHHQQQQQILQHQMQQQ